MTPDAPTPESSRRRESSVPLTAAHPPTTPQAPAGFRPVCPTCKYDLNGSPDGACPECGTPFTHAALIFAAINFHAHMNRNLGSDLFVIGVGLVVVVVTCAGGFNTDQTRANFIAFVLLCGSCVVVRAIRKRTGKWPNGGGSALVTLAVLAWTLTFSQSIGVIDILTLFAATIVTFLAFAPIPIRQVAFRVAWAVSTTCFALSAATFMSAGAAKWSLFNGRFLAGAAVQSLGLMLLLSGGLLAALLIGLHLHRARVQAKSRSLGFGPRDSSQQSDATKLDLRSDVIGPD